MSAWERASICGIYTVSPLHVSTGQAEGAIDLPVMKEPHTGYPVIPASSLKGVARDRTKDKLAKALHTKIFGPELRKNDSQTSDTETPKLEIGALVFTEARLVAFSVRSLNRPFLHVTCRLVLERLDRDLRAAKIPLGSLSLPSTNAKVLVADTPLSKTTLVLEDLVYTTGDVASSSDLTRIAKLFSTLLPKAEDNTRRRLEKGLIVIPDEDFSALVTRLPVRARIRLGENKTTSGDDGNLWYEEQVPADCLFVSLIGARRGKAEQLAELEAVQGALTVSQIGGNETVGEGICFWTLAEVTQ